MLRKAMRQVAAAEGVAATQTSQAAALMHLEPIFANQATSITADMLAYTDLQDLIHYGADDAADEDDAHDSDDADDDDDFVTSAAASDPYFKGTGVAEYNLLRVTQRRKVA